METETKTQPRTNLVTLAKRAVARALVPRILPCMLDWAPSLDWLLGRAFEMQVGKISPEAGRQSIEIFFAGTASDEVGRRLGLDRHRERLSRPGQYHVGLSRMPEEPWRTVRIPTGPLGRRLWPRRVALMRHLGVAADLVILRRGESVPPHGHRRVVSGFYVIEGRVAVRHYDRVEDRGDSVLVRKTFDAILGPGGFTTNDEFHRNIHWLRGLAETSFLMLFSCTRVPGPVFGRPGSGTGSREYVDPTGPEREDGTVVAPYVEERVARELAFEPAGTPVSR